MSLPRCAAVVAQLRLPSIAASILLLEFATVIYTSVSYHLPDLCQFAITAMNGNTESITESTLSYAAARGNQCEKGNHYKVKSSISYFRTFATVLAD